MKRRILSASLAALFTLSNSGITAATSANISPHTQNHASGHAASWTATWGDDGPYNVVFRYDVYGSSDGWSLNQVWQTSKFSSYRFYTCTGATFTQLLDMDDLYGSAQHYSTTTVAAGGICGPVRT